MTKPERAREWARNFDACLSSQSKCGALAGAMRDGVLADMLKEMKITSPVQLVEALCSR